MTAGGTLIRDVRVFDGERVVEADAVLLREGLIAEVGPGAADPGDEVVDGRGGTLLPGLIDGHAHPSPADLGRALTFGVTTVMHMFCGPALVPRLRQAALCDDAADVRLSSAGASPTGGVLERMHGHLPTLDRPEDAAAFVAARVAEGADYVKVFLGDREPRLSEATVRAVVAAAHAHGRIALVHAETGDEARMFIDAGGDALAHVLNGLDLDTAFLARLTRAFVVPTLRVAAVLSPSSAAAADEARRCLLAHPRLGPYLDPAARAALEAPAPRLPPATSRFDLDSAGLAARAMLDAGTPVVAGTDAPPTDPARPNPMMNALAGQGIALHHELELLVQAGLTPAQALAAATSVAARCFRLGDRGRIATGARADLLLVAGDPIRDVTATREIVAVWRRGVRLDREARRT